MKNPDCVISHAEMGVRKIPRIGIPEERVLWILHDFTRFPVPSELKGCNVMRIMVGLDKAIFRGSSKSSPEYGIVR